MSVWDAYSERSARRGSTKRDAAYNREVSYINRKLPDNLSYTTVAIDGIEQDVAVINSDNLNEKMIFSLPGEDIVHGGLVEWMDNRWLVTERDANTTLYARARMVQCNHLLKWVDKDDIIREQWCIVEDGTKLRRTPVRHSLAYGKLYVKTIPLIAGNPLEPSYRNGTANSRIRHGVKTRRIGQSAAAPRTEGGSTTTAAAPVHPSGWKWGTLNRRLRHGEDIVCALRKRGECHWHWTERRLRSKQNGSYR